MPAAVWVPAAIAAGGGIVNSAINSHAAGNAADVQAKGAADALAEQKRIFDLQTAQRKPYLDASTAALGNLQNLASRPMQGAPAPYQWGGYNRPMAPAAPPAGNLGQLAFAPGVTPQMAPRPASGPQGPAQMGREPMVTLAAPDGTIQQVPQSQEQHFLSRGARRVQ